MPRLTLVAEEQPDPRPPLAVLLEQRNLSKRRFAKMLAESDGRRTWESWLRAVRQYTSDDPVIPTDATAELMERVLEVPAGTLTQPSRRTLREKRLRQLEEENRRLRAELDRLQSERGDNPA